MIQSLINDGFHMVICQGIEHGFSFPPTFHQAGVLQGSELVRNRGLGHTQQLSDIADAHLCFKQDVQNSDAGGIAENSEQFAQVI